MQLCCHFICYNVQLATLLFLLFWEKISMQLRYRKTCLCNYRIHEKRKHLTQFILNLVVFLVLLMYKNDRILNFGVKKFRNEGLNLNLSCALLKKSIISIFKGYETKIQYNKSACYETVLAGCF